MTFIDITSNLSCAKIKKKKKGSHRRHGEKIGENYFPWGLAEAFWGHWTIEKSSETFEGKRKYRQ